MESTDPGPEDTRIETAAPPRGMLLPELSLSRMVTTEVEEPSAVNEVDAAVTVEVVADGIPGFSVITG
jgi:hypothetical protein